MYTLYRFFKSVKLAVVLIAIIAIGSIFATLVPQREETEFYFNKYSRPVFRLIVGLYLDVFFRSPLFVVAAVLFVINLMVCTIDRLVRVTRGKRKLRFGPDIVHIGLLILVLGGLVSVWGRQEGFIFLGEGDQVRLPGDYILSLISFEFLLYEDGRPQDWVSTVDVFRENELVKDDYAIEVNRPLRLGRIKLFQSSYSEAHQVVFRHPEGTEFVLNPEEPIHAEDVVYMFKGVEVSDAGEVRAVFEEWRDGRVTELKKLDTNAKLQDYELLRINRRNLTGIQAVSDPGYLPVLVGLVLCTIGLVLTYAQKIGDNQI